MLTQHLKTNIRYHTDLAIIDLEGEINTDTEKILNQAYTEATTQKAKTILLNLSAVKYITSSGMALMVDLLGRARQTDRGLAVFGLSSHYQEIFRMMHLTDFITIFPDEAAALQKLAD